MKRTAFRLFAAVLFLAACTFAGGAETAADLAGLQGAARARLLLEGARAEGEVTIYHTNVTEDLQPLFDAFTKKYGVKVRNWRSSSENVLQRIVQEARGGRHDVDFVENNSPEMEALYRERLLQRVASPVLQDFPARSIPAHGAWIGSSVELFVQAYNTRLVKKEELPTRFADLLDPRWKGRLGIEAEDQSWFATLLIELGEEAGLKLFRDIVATNGISVRKGHTLLANLVASGEIPFALTVYHYKPPQLKEKGGAIDSYVMQPAVGQLRGVGVIARAPHPHAAILFFDFMLGEEGQAILASRGFYPSNRKVPSRLGNVAFRLIDPGQALDRQEQWTRLYEETITKRARKP